MFRKGHNDIVYERLLAPFLRNKLAWFELYKRWGSDLMTMVNCGSQAQNS